MASTTIKADSTAEAYLALLADRGVEYLFGNSGTDFPSIIEALSKAAATGTRAPIPVTVPHENVAVSMAHGFYLVSGRPQAVMVHVTVGTANAVCGIMNAAREHVPIIFTAGRSPLTEDGLTGARSLYIHWGQEMFDQAGMVRELVKWDYELRNAHQLETVVDRAINIAMSEPRGPIYLTLPREVLAAAPGAFAFDTPSRRQAARQTAPDAAAIERSADIIAAASNPAESRWCCGTAPNAVTPRSSASRTAAAAPGTRSPGVTSRPSVVTPRATKSGPTTRLIRRVCAASYAANAGAGTPVICG